MLRQHGRRGLHRLSHFGIPFTATSHNGIPGLYSKAGLDTAWFGYQQHLLDGLNSRIAGTSYELNNVQQISFRAARQPSDAAVFNYASQAWNNHFFFRCLRADRRDGRTSDEDTEVKISDHLMKDIQKVFGGVKWLREQMLHTAAAIFGSGWVWLVMVKEGGGGGEMASSASASLRILATYNAGSPFDLQFARQRDPNTNQHVSSSIGSVLFPNSSSTSSSSSSSSSPASRNPILPILGVSCWEHSWVTDYGVAGKEAYLANWWDTIDWQKVDEHHRAQRTPSSYH